MQVNDDGCGVAHGQWEIRVPHRVGQRDVRHDGLGLLYLQGGANCARGCSGAGFQGARTVPGDVWNCVHVFSTSFPQRLYASVDYGRWLSRYIPGISPQRGGGAVTGAARRGLHI